MTAVGSRTYSAIGTANIMGAAYKKLDVAKLDRGILMSDGDGPKPTADQAKTEAATPLAQQLRASLLQTMGLSETEVQHMRSDTRADFESHMTQRIHEQPRRPRTPALARWSTFWRKSGSENLLERGGDGCGE
jgi:hypothetical protein